MDDFSQLGVLVSMFVMTLPTFSVCLVAVIIILAKWRQAGSGSAWALLGFGLALFLCLAMPIGQTLLQRWVFMGGDVGDRTWAFTAFSFMGSLLYAGVYALLLAAVLAGRTKPAYAPSPPNA